MAEIFRILNSAVPFTRDEAEAILQALVDIQKVTGRLAGVMTDRLDAIDGDADDHDTSDAEDAEAFTYNALRFASGPGCFSSDTGENAWAEWHTLRPFQKRGPALVGAHEDDEEVDVREDDDPAEDDLEDSCEAGDDGCGAFPRHGITHWGSLHEGEAETAPPPSYGVDQSRGPLNPNGEDQGLSRA